MLKTYAFVLISTLSLLMFSCKNETQDTKKMKAESAIVDTVQKTPVKRAPKKDLSPEDRIMLQSVMTRIMKENNLKMFASYVVTANLSNELSNGEGPFIIFAPSNSALQSLTAEKKKFYSNPENIVKLEEMLKSHIVVDEKALMKSLNNTGKINLKTLAGTALILTKSDENIVVSNSKGVMGKVLKSSVESSNGAVYIIDNLLNLN